MLIKRSKNLIVCKTGKVPEGFIEVLVDRRTVLGNPFSMKKYGITRKEACARHHAWMLKKLKINSPQRKELKRIAALLDEGKRVALICHCKPKQCHGDNYVDPINSFRKK